MVVEPVTLTGQVVQLEPMLPAHRDFFVEVGLDEELWRWIPDPVRSPEEMFAYVDAALQQQASGVSLPFTIVERASGKVIGSTRYANIERVHRRLEIGWTWIAIPWQRTPVNTECKYLLLRHAFETLGCIRVELKTDSLNERSRRAIARIGARRGHFPQPHDHFNGQNPPLGLLQRDRFGMAWRESPPRREIEAALKNAVPREFAPLPFPLCSILETFITEPHSLKD